METEKLELEMAIQDAPKSLKAELRRLHARVQELEKDRGNAKRLVSKIWNQHPEARDTIEKATGAWLVFGQDVETSGVSAHPDDAAVDALTVRMKAKLAKKRDKGYGGWDTYCTRDYLSELLRSHCDKGDPVDVANFCAFLSARGESIAPQPQVDGRDAAWSDLKIAFDIPDGEDETLWKCVESGAITLPNGWKLIETTGAGGVGPVAVFRTEHLPTSSETFVVGSAINYAIAAQKGGAV